MKAVSGMCAALCGVCIAVTVLSVLTPQKRTAKILSFVTGLFLISTVLGIFTDNSSDIISDISSVEKYEPSECSYPNYDDTIAQMTADNITYTLNELLKDEGIYADDIRLKLKITDEGRIFAARVVIYISEDYISRRGDIKSIVYGNLSKEPEIYVKGQEAERNTQ